MECLDQRVLFGRVCCFGLSESQSEVYRIWSIPGLLFPSDCGLGKPNHRSWTAFDWKAYAVSVQAHNERYMIPERVLVGLVALVVTDVSIAALSLSLVRLLRAYKAKSKARAKRVSSRATRPSSTLSGAGQPRQMYTFLVAGPFQWGRGLYVTEFLGRGRHLRHGGGNGSPFGGGNLYGVGHDCICTPPPKSNLTDESEKQLL